MILVMSHLINSGDYGCGRQDLLQFLLGEIGHSNRADLPYFWIKLSVSVTMV